MATQLEMFTRAVFLGATRPQTPRLQSPPLEADAGSIPPRHSLPLRPRWASEKEKTTDGIIKDHGHEGPGQYSSQPGGFIFDAHLAHFSIAVSRPEGFATRSGRSMTSFYPSGCSTSLLNETCWTSTEPSMRAGNWSRLYPLLIRDDPRTWRDRMDVWTSRTRSMPKDGTLLIARSTVADSSTAAPRGATLRVKRGAIPSASARVRRHTEREQLLPPRHPEL